MCTAVTTLQDGRVLKCEQAVTDDLCYYHAKMPDLLEPCRDPRFGSPVVRVEAGRKVLFQANGGSDG